jgi:hypothetical protein
MEWRNVETVSIMTKKEIMDVWGLNNGHFKSIQQKNITGISQKGHLFSQWHDLFTAADKNAFHLYNDEIREKLQAYFEFYKNHRLNKETRDRIKRNAELAERENEFSDESQVRSSDTDLPETE